LNSFSEFGNIDKPIRIGCKLVKSSGVLTGIK